MFLYLDGGFYFEGEMVFDEFVYLFRVSVFVSWGFVRMEWVFEFWGWVRFGIGALVIMESLLGGI